MLIECGKLDWRRINPDIFGSMFQGVMDEEIRHELGAHYTSIPNIMKVINPLFMDDLREEFEKCKGSEKKLKELQQRISKIKIFDPACGSGNFLITAYKELRHLEMDIIDEIGRISGPQLGCLSFMTVDHFYGIEINPFAVELAKLSIWLAEHQMNVEFQDKFSVTVPSIPLKDSAKIVAANACRIDWEEVCPKGEDDEIYILGNPPYLGARNQSKSQKDDMELIFDKHKDFKDSDYVMSWFIKASKYIQSYNAQYSFVSTNSTTQGEQVSYLFSRIFMCGQEIAFAYKSFKWSNSAKKNAGVFCVVIGIRNKKDRNLKRIFSNSSFKYVSNISPYLIEGSDTIIKRRKSTISNIPKLVSGSMARDGGNLILSESEMEEIINNYPHAKHLLRNLVGSQEFLKATKRYCLWIEDEHLHLAKSIPLINSRILQVHSFRNESSAKTTRGYASIPHKFAQRAHKNSPSIIIPKVSSANREYIPIGFLDSNSIITDLAFAIYDAKPYLFAILTSKIHMVWVHLTAGRLGEGYRYSTAVCYNNFPVPSIQRSQIDHLEELSFNILEARDMHPGKTLAELYDPDKMPQNLRDTHHELDLAVDAIYRKEPFKNDEERLAHLFKLYEKMTSGEKK